MIFFPLLAADMMSGLFPPSIMNFVVPGAVAAGIFAFVVYKIFRQLGWL